MQPTHIECGNFFQILYSKKKKKNETLQNPHKGGGTSKIFYVILFYAKS